MIEFKNGDIANLNQGATPTTVSLKDATKPGASSMPVVLVSMQDAHNGRMWNAGTAEDFVNSCSNHAINVVAKGWRSKI